ncbi:alpha/beta hydrolase [Paractinoplanes durhamensis]|uniref:Lysophospholipase n=1 Tax=Paractinoplanes durhamensis TaxID=113563 RepID=A0ABQ3Z4R5_9ACTN|nr:alpha/beta fold hydrolase [Actinoplanes durhamensis]GIE04789.1 lysophospholipase [Actinoplanes durhamensis]
MTPAREDAVITWTEPDPVPLRGTLVVLPGRGESAPIYERFGRRLAADAYRVHVLGTAPSDSPERAHEQLAEIIETADVGTPRIVVGSDAGAAYAAHLAAQGKLTGVAALVLAGLPVAAAAAPARDWDDELDARTFCSTHRGRISAAGVRPAELFTDLPAAWFDPAVPAGVDLPVLGLHGRDDDISPVAEARAWYAATPRAELVTIAGGRHDVLNDQTHRTVAATVVLFLERLRGSSALTPIAVTEALGDPR